MQPEKEVSAKKRRIAAALVTIAVALSGKSLDEMIDEVAEQENVDE